ncbi:baseplate assembly protein [Erythrobacter sp. EC-HK427]|uniref:baseplate assembly protein n=1 Tax=Erythrobacter sp. EC-HK427 TaxID=2038396 RepID=UPI0012547323|nr:baseplate J/gp47 family protein [Erythrobacter sp. EC-HK427]VVT07410.1 Baseplate assembly protein J [Erythrobacter sp. EC-HK427]
MPAATTSSATSTAIDLSRLPAPAVIEELDFEAILAKMKARFIAAFPQFTADLESEPAIKLLEVFSYEVLVLRQRVNDAARACMLAFAGGSDLDQLAALYGVTRREITPANEDTGAPAVFESDADLRRRVLQAPDSFSVAGPAAAYVFHALAASGDVADVAATSPAPGEVLVSVLARDGDGTAPAELLAEVEAATNADDVRPLTDEVTVQSAEIITFAIDAQLTLYPGPDSALILATAEAQLADLLATNRRIGRDITRSAIFAALHVAGVQNVDLVAPAADVTIGETQAAHADPIAITIAGLDV